jgi:hypothetical protein
MIATHKIGEKKNKNKIKKEKYCVEMIDGLYNSIRRKLCK